VEFLLLEGLPQGAIAQFLKKSDRTIRRDVEDVRKSYKITKNVIMTSNILADFIFNAKVHQAHFMRLARSNGASASEKTKAEAEAWKVGKEVLQELSYIGLLMVTQDIVENKGKETFQLFKGPLSEEQRAVMKDLDGLSGLDREFLVERLLKLVHEEERKEDEEFAKKQEMALQEIGLSGNA
jgi:hypothetical protein